MWRRKRRLVNDLGAEPVRGRARGLTLVELMVAVGVLTIAMTALMAGLLATIVSSEFSKAKTVAINDAKSVLEQLANRPVAGAVGCANNCLLDEVNAINTNNTNATVVYTPANLVNEDYTVTVQPVNSAGVVTGAPVTNLAPPYVDSLLITVRVDFQYGNRPTFVTVQKVVTPMENPLS